MLYTRQVMHAAITVATIGVWDGLTEFSIDSDHE